VKKILLLLTFLLSILLTACYDISNSENEISPNPAIRILPNPEENGNLYHPNNGKGNNGGGPGSTTYGGNSENG
jgi:hypothetical protein